MLCMLHVNFPFAHPPQGKGGGGWGGPRPANKNALPSAAFPHYYSTARCVNSQQVLTQAAQVCCDSIRKTTPHNLSSNLQSSPKPVRELHIPHKDPGIQELQLVRHCTSFLPRVQCPGDHITRQTSWRTEAKQG
jgi:hypothetical protein